MDHAQAESLYQITQRMDTDTGLCDEILRFLANASVIVDDMRRDPQGAAEKLRNMHDEREYRKLLDEGFTPEEAIQWLERRAAGIETRKWITGMWRKRQAKGKDFAILTNQITAIVHGKTAT